jgi:cobalt-precorrin 5A hydrolase
MTRTAIVAVSRHGSVLARSLAASLPGDTVLYLQRRFHQDDGESQPFDPPARSLVHQVFEEYQRLVLFLPVGAAVRLLAPCLKDKRKDPAVVCVDDAGRFAVSLLSGHLGGADRLAEEVAQALGATAVVTSASHAAGTLAVDLLGHGFGWRLEAEPVAITRASAAVVNGEPVGVYQEAGEPHWWPQGRPLPGNIAEYATLESLMQSKCAAALVITDRQDPAHGQAGSYRSAFGDRPVMVYRPRTLAAGMGCRRGVPAQELEDLLTDTFRRHNLALGSLRCIATAELKRDEPGLCTLADKYGVPMPCYSAEELNSVFSSQPELEEPGRVENPPNPPLPKGGKDESQASGKASISPTPSPVARRLLGLWGVSEPAALLAAGSQELLVTRVKTSRATIAVARVVFPGGGG